MIKLNKITEGCGGGPLCSNILSFNKNMKYTGTGDGSNKNVAEHPSSFLLHYLPQLQTQLSQIRFCVYTGIRR